jgi:hypothetical protein
MNRRDFLKLTSLAGLGVAGTAFAGPGFTNKVMPYGLEYDGPFYVFVNAGGGWDPTSLCDPKGREDEDETDPMNMYFSGDIGTAGNISYAPVGGNQAFFDKHFERLCVINGIDMQTNGHDSGSRHTWSGRLAEGYPSLGALISANYGPALPMSYLSFGGYDFTAGIVARTRSGNVGALERLAYPDRINPDDELSRYHSERAQELILDARAGRQSHLEATELLPTSQHAMGLLFTAQIGADELKKLAEFLPDPLDNSGNPLNRQAQVALAAYRAGISVSTNLNMGGFDTHGNHDASHIPRLQTLLEGIDFLWEEAAAQGVQDKLVIIVGSDFGRTPGYNDTDGKDHWSVTSLMAMGAGISGNRVIGLTDERHSPLMLDPSDLTKEKSDGMRIRPEHIHTELRKKAGVDDTDAGNLFPIFPPEDPNIFG